MDKRLLTGLAALTLLDISASTASAQDWTGAYVGIHGGYRWSDAHLTTGAYTLNNPVDVDPIVPPRSETFSLGSGIIGLHGGYNVGLAANWLLGFETDVDWGAGDETKTRSILIDGVAYKLVSRAELNWQSTVRARLGVTSGPWLFFGTVGVAVADFGWSETFSRPGSFSFSVSKSDLLVGWVLGAGAEFAITRNWIVRAEYLFEDFGSLKVPLAAALPPGTTGNMDVEAQKVRVGISYRF